VPEKPEPFVLSITCGLVLGAQSKRAADVIRFPSPVGHQIALEDSANLLDSLEKRLEYLRSLRGNGLSRMGSSRAKKKANLRPMGRSCKYRRKRLRKLIQSEAAKVQGERGKAPGSPEITLSQTRFEFEKIRQGTSLKRPIYDYKPWRRSTYWSNQNKQRVD